MGEAIYRKVEFTGRPMSLKRFLRTLSTEALNELAKGGGPVYGPAISDELSRRARKGRGRGPAKSAEESV